MRRACVHWVIADNVVADRKRPFPGVWNDTPSRHVKRVVADTPYQLDTFNLKLKHLLA